MYIHIYKIWIQFNLLQVANIKADADMEVITKSIRKALDAKH
jgi:hypothetical protein